MNIESYEWRLGEILVQNKWITLQQLEEALTYQRAVRNETERFEGLENFEEKKTQRLLHIGEILVQHEWITWAQLREALKSQQESGKVLGEILIEKGYLNPKNLYRALALLFNLPFADFSKISIHADALLHVSKEFVYEYGVIPFLKREKSLLVAISDPLNLKPETELRRVIPHLQIQTALAAPGDIQSAILKYYGPQQKAAGF